METKIGFFQEAPGEKSMARMQAFGFSCWAIISSGYIFFKEGSAAGIATFTAVAAIALGIKLWSKAQEIQESKNNLSKPI